ncbi:MAG: adenylate kinase [Nitrospinota bacterium]
MRIIFLGPPGAGKGTQAKKICAAYNIPQISTGDILRVAVANKTKIGLEIKSIMESGQLVSDSIIINVINERLDHFDCKSGYLLDGFPRTVTQAKVLSEMLDNKGDKIDYVIDINVELDELVRRITGRRICESCSQMWHIEFLPPSKDGFCDNCGGKLYQRADDVEETIKKRYNLYKDQSDALNAYYSDQGIYHKFDGAIAIDQLTKQIETLIKGD